jgi:hypothetical protein
MAGAAFTAIGLLGALALVGRRAWPARIGK